MCFYVLQIKTEDFSEALQPGIPHRPCHLSQGSIMGGGQMTGVGHYCIIYNLIGINVFLGYGRKNG